MIYSLPYLPPEWATSTFFAYQGTQDTQWLRDKSKRSFGPHADIRTELKTGALVAEVVQAANRIRCRRVVDEEGNCLPCDIFIRVPTGERGSGRT